MKKVLSLDVSSSTIGWALFNYDALQFSLLDYGYLKPIKKDKGSTSARLNHACMMINDVLENTQPDEIAIEDYAKRFSQGRSSANTIIMLSTFNELVSLMCFQFLKNDVLRYPVVTIRAQIGKLFEMKLVSKDDIFPAVVNKSKIFIPVLNKKGNIKEEMKDVVDAMAVGMTHIIKTQPSAKNYSI